MTSLGRLARRWKLSRRLRALQNAYYDGDPGDTGAIGDYLRTLAEARATVEAARRPGEIRIHAGSGGHYVEGWVNVDWSPGPPVDLVADLGRSLPFRSGAARYIHCEDFIEHLDRPAGDAFLGECYRVLEPGGVLRILTPDLRAIVEQVYLGRDPRHLRWCDTYLEADDPCEALNMHMRMNGDHRFLFDEEHLASSLRKAGFEPRRVRFNASREPALRFLDLRDFGLSLYVEGVKRHET